VCDVCVVHLPVMCFVFVGFCVMCEVRCLSFVSTVGCVLWCLLCDSVRILRCVTFCVLCYYVIFSLKSVICWFNVRGGVYVVVCVFPGCCVLSVL